MKSNQETQTQAPADIPMTLHPKEAALIMFIRRIRQGCIGNIGIKDGLPTAFVAVEQRVNLEDPGAVSRLFEVEGSFFPMGRG